MEKRKSVVTGTLSVLVLVVLVAAGFITRRYRRGIQNAYSRLERGDSEIIHTECGEVEYTAYGEGYAILVVHGIFGGFDQGLVMARGQIGEGFRSIIPSRFGYLGSPIPEEPSSELQADAFACLLDALGIDQAAILGTSAGGTSAIQFALRHPERCSALILVSSNAPGEAVGLPPRPLANILFRSDFAFWMLANPFRSTMYSIMGVPEGYELTPEQEQEMEEVIHTVLPVKPRAEGALFDMYVSNPAINEGYRFEDISVPTLIIHAQDDPLASFQNAYRMADRIPGAEFLSIPDGGHPLLGHEEVIRSTITNFLDGSVHRAAFKG